MLNSDGKHRLWGFTKTLKIVKGLQRYYILNNLV